MIRPFNLIFSSFMENEMPFRYSELISCVARRFAFSLNVGILELGRNLHSYFLGKFSKRWKYVNWMNCLLSIIMSHSCSNFIWAHMVFPWQINEPWEGSSNASKTMNLHLVWYTKQKSSRVVLGLFKGWLCFSSMKELFENLSRLSIWESRLIQKYDDWLRK